MPDVEVQVDREAGPVTAKPSQDRRAYNRQYYLEHKEEIKARARERTSYYRQYYNEHREEILAKAKARYQARKALSAAQPPIPTQ